MLPRQPRPQHGVVHTPQRPCLQSLKAQEVEAAAVDVIERRVKVLVQRDVDAAAMAMLYRFPAKAAAR